MRKRGRLPVSLRGAIVSSVAVCSMKSKPDTQNRNNGDQTGDFNYYNKRDVHQFVIDTKALSI
jgi:hypothetical protein